MKDPLIIRILRRVPWITEQMRVMRLLGTPTSPRYFKAGDRVPFWVFVYWPRCIVLTFVVDVEVFGDRYRQHVYPLAPLAGDDVVLLDVANESKYLRDAWLIGDTTLHLKPRLDGGGNARAFELALVNCRA